MDDIQGLVKNLLSRTKQMYAPALKGLQSNWDQVNDPNAMRSYTEDFAPYVMGMTGPVSPKLSTNMLKAMAFEEKAREVATRIAQLRTSNPSYTESNPALKSLIDLSRNLLKNAGKLRNEP